MSRLLSVIIALLVSLAATAQREQDFAERYVRLYGAGAPLTCKTVSPQMIERMLPLTADKAAAFRPVIAQLKSIRMVQSEAGAQASQLYAQAEQLARVNRKRYALYASDEGRGIYLRRRGKVIVELVMLSHTPDQQFSIVDLTGNMTGDFIRELMKI